MNSIPGPSLSPSDKEILARTATGLLRLHERVYEDMESAVSSLEGVSDSTKVEESVKAVCRLFEREVRGLYILENLGESKNFFSSSSLANH